MQSWGDIKEFEENIKCIAFEDTSKIQNCYIIKMFKGHLVKGVLSQKTKIKIAFTVDFFISIYKDSQKFEEKIHSIPFDKLALQIKKNQVTLSYQAKKLLWNSKVKINIFLTDENLEEF